jgi:hypothetical protein
MRRDKSASIPLCSSSGVLPQQTDGAPHATAERPKRALVAVDQARTLVAVIEMGQASWLVAGIVPGVNRHPLKEIATDQEQLLRSQAPDRTLATGDHW